MVLSCKAYVIPTPKTLSLAAAFGTLEADVGRVLAKIVSDPRTLNKRVVIKANEFSQPDIVTAWEKVSGKQVEREDMSAEQYATSTKGVPLFIFALHSLNTFFAHSVMIGKAASVCSIVTHESKESFQHYSLQALL